MKNRVVVNILGEDYTLLAEENEEYVLKTADLVRGKIDEIVSAAPVPTMNAVVLAALNIADEYFKAVDAADNMRAQMKSYLDDASRLRAELNEARRELNKLKSGR